MKYGLFVLTSALFLMSCAQKTDLQTEPITAPPEDVVVDFKSIIAELLPDSHENLAIGAKPRKACQSVHTNYSSENDILDTIIESAKNHRLVIINEAHNRASHRAFS